MRVVNEALKHTRRALPQGTPNAMALLMPVSAGTQREREAISHSDMIKQPNPAAGFKITPVQTSPRKTAEKLCRNGNF